MDDIELRLAAVEKVILAILPWLGGAALEDAEATIRAELQTAEGAERDVGLYALELLTDGKERFRRPYSLGLFVREGPSAERNAGPTWRGRKH